MSEKELSELAHALYLALQAIVSCPNKCKCCDNHVGPALQALMAYVNRWRT
jgi:hypothetical protein